MTVYVVMARGFMCSDWVYAVFAERADAERFAAAEAEGLTFDVDEFELRGTERSGLSKDDVRRIVREEVAARVPEARVLAEEIMKYTMERVKYTMERENWRR